MFVPVLSFVQSLERENSISSREMLASPNRLSGWSQSGKLCVVIQDTFYQKDWNGIGVYASLLHGYII